MALPVGKGGVNWLKLHMKAMDDVIEKEEKLEKLARTIGPLAAKQKAKVKKVKRKRKRESSSMSPDEKPRTWSHAGLASAAGFGEDEQETSVWGRAGGFKAKKPWETEKAQREQEIEEEDPAEVQRRRLKQELRLQQLARQKADQDRADREARGPRQFKHKSWCNEKCNGRCDPQSWDKFCKTAPSAVRKMGEARAEKTGAEKLLDDLHQKAQKGQSGRADDAEC
eukprot:TRINITY_DN65884_c0_g1_i1.p2 TRINITY_DN65884_c0_g1~~TRINITY_DN65884_c0_g1_i1.p2  ORF type:complete len:225 (+),score=74.19 TRINITY_DN65884_c0_g1_i1:118-792(+)